MTNIGCDDIIVFGFILIKIKRKGGIYMPVTDLLRRNAREHGDEIALVELNPTMEDTRKISFKEFDLVQQTKSMPYRHEITWDAGSKKVTK